MSWQCTVTPIFMMIAMFIMMAVAVWKCIISPRGFKYSSLLQHSGPKNDNNRVGWDNMDEEEEEEGIQSSVELDDEGAEEKRKLSFAPLIQNQ